MSEPNYSKIGRRAYSKRDSLRGAPVAIATGARILRKYLTADDFEGGEDWALNKPEIDGLYALIEYAADSLYKDVASLVDEDDFHLARRDRGEQ